MKNIFYSTLLICILSMSGCTVGGNTDPTPPQCDNQLSSCSLSLGWVNAYYNCTSGAFGISTPPNASFYNYVNAISANGTQGSLATSTAYLCQITVKNDQPSEYPNNPCQNPGSLVSTWNTAGTSLAINVYKNHNSDITVDYYDICAACSTAIPEARPYFVGVATVPTGAVAAFIPMQTQAPFVGAVTPCQ